MRRYTHAQTYTFACLPASDSIKERKCQKKRYEQIFIVSVSQRSEGGGWRNSKILPKSLRILLLSR